MPNKRLWSLTPLPCRMRMQTNPHPLYDADAEYPRKWAYILRAPNSRKSMVIYVCQL